MTTIIPKSTITTICINTVDTQKILYLPAASTIPAGGLLYIKDICGNAATSSIILSTTGFYDTIDNKLGYTSTFSNIYNPSYTILSTNGLSAMLMPDGITNWMVLQNNTSNPVYGRLGYSTGIFTYFYNLALNANGNPNGYSLGTPTTSPLGPGCQGWYYPLFTSNVSSINFSNYAPPGNKPGTANSCNHWGFGAKGYIYSASNTTIQFQTLMDDGMVVYLNNSTVLSRWSSASGTIPIFSPVLPLNSGYNSLAITYYQITANNRALFSWAIPAGTEYISNAIDVIYYNEASKRWDMPLLKTSLY